MVRLKRILLENEQQEQFKKDCQPFLQQNEDQLRDGFFLKRASSNEYDSFTKKGYRERKGVYSPDLYYFYEKYKPSSAPSRKELIPTYGKAIADEAFQEESYNNYAVFPVGNNYKMAYNYYVEDFNYNDLLEKHGLDSFHCLNDFGLNMGFLLGRISRSEQIQLPSEFEQAKIFAADIKCSVETEKVKRNYDDFFEFLELYSFEELKDKIDMDKSLPDRDPEYIHEEIKQNLKNYKEYFDDYFASFEVTQELKNSMIRREVGLYAPDGFYYVPEQEETLVIDVLDEPFS